MKLRELLTTIEQVAKRNEISKPLICGGAVREKVMGTLTKLDDIDITNGESSIKNLAKEVELELGKTFAVHSKTMDDSHTSIFIGKKFKLDFSSNFISPSIEQELTRLGVKNSTGLTKEAYSRDFTANSLIMDFSLQNIYDPTKKGLSDIKSKILRTCLSPEITLNDNLNRLIRIVYLSAKLDFSIDPAIVEFVKGNQNLFSKLDPAYLSNTLNKAIQYNPKKTAAVLDELDLWKVLPITEQLYPYYEKRFKTAQLRQNFDYGEGFYANLQKEKSVSQFRKKRKKKQKKDIKGIRKMKLAYYNGIEEYLTDNFPVVLNDDLETKMDRRENKAGIEEALDQEDKDEGEDGGDTGETLLNPANYSDSMFGSMHGTEGLTTMPVAEFPGHLGEDHGAVVNNDYNELYQPSGLLGSKALFDLATHFHKLSII